MSGKLLVVDDIEINRDILAETFKDQYEILQADNGRKALECLNENKDIDAVLLDLVMPELDGIGVLKEMNWANMLKKIPVFVVTAESDLDSLSDAYNFGAVDVIMKPYNANFIRRRIDSVIELYRTRNELQQTVVEQYRKLDSLNLNLIEMLASVIEFRDCESGEHVKRISTLTKIVMKEVCELYPEYEMPYSQIIKISNAAVLHDVGKIAIPDNILTKPGRLTPEEFEIMKQHTVKGCAIMESFPKVLDKETYDYAYDICRHHHERWDGRGYPDKLQGDEISIWSQVVAIVDVYDALISPRVYKKMIPHDEAVRMIKAGECGVFNPKILEAFDKAISINGGGTLNSK